MRAHHSCNAIITLALVLIGGCSTSPNPYDPLKPEGLMPFGPHADSPALIRYISPDLPTDIPIEVGDEILEVDGAAVPGTFAFYQMLNPNFVNIKVKGKSAGEKVVPMHHPAKGEPVVNWAWLFEPGQVIAFGLDNPTYGVSQPAALLSPTNSIAL